MGTGRLLRWEGGSSSPSADPRCRVYAMMPVDVVNEGPCLQPSRSPGLARSPPLTPVVSNEDRPGFLLQLVFEAAKQIPGSVEKMPLT